MTKSTTAIDNNTASSQKQTQDQKICDLLKVLEHQMKDLWTQYVNCMNQNGPADETAEALRGEYFKLYHNYKNNKEWQKVIHAQDL